MAFKMKPSSFKQPEWSKNEAGYDVKTTTRKNLFGREREVKKYYDPETGEKLGKHVTVDRAEGDPRAKKQKIKRVNRGLTQEGGVGKIRLKENPWENPSGKSNGGSETDLNRAQRTNQINIEEGGDFEVLFGDDGPGLIDYATSFGGMKLNDAGRKVNPRNDQTYENSPEGLKAFEKEAEEWWDEQAAKTNNPKLKEQDQEYGLDEHGNVKYSKSPNKKVRGYKMKKKRK
jgi:hypothetical protein